MTKYMMILAILACSFGYSQNALKVIVKDSKTQENLIGVSVQVQKTTISGITDNSGSLELNAIKNGEQKIVFNLLGYEDFFVNIIFPRQNQEALTVELSPADEEELDEV